MFRFWIALEQLLNHFARRDFFSKRQRVGRTAELEVQVGCTTWRFLRKLILPDP